MKYPVLVLLVFFSIFASGENLPDKGRVVQEIRYHSAEASEVFLVWGVNNWAQPAQEWFPDGSFIRDALVHTPMVQRDGYFSAKIPVPAGTSLDFVFWITRGVKDSPTDIWDTNKPGKDYHTVVLHDNVTLIESGVQARPPGNLSILDFSGSVFIILLLSAGSFFFIRRRCFNKTELLPVNGRIVAIALATWIFLTLLRASVLGISWDIYIRPGSHLGELFSASYYDLIYVICFTLIFLLLKLFLTRYPHLQKTLPVLFGIFAFFSVLFAILNIRVVEMLGRPFNYQWLYYSDFLKSADARSAMIANLPASYLVNVGLTLLSLFLCSFFLLCILNICWIRLKYKKAGLLILFGGIFSLLSYSSRTIKEKKWDYDKLANPVTAFLQSVNPFAAPPELFTMPVPDSLRYVRTSVIPDMMPGTEKIRNVIFFVLESTPAEYVDVYGSKYQLTPHLKAYSEQALIFDNIYAHAPATNLSMVSMLASVYPWLSYNSMTQEHPGLAVPTINSVLKDHGYRSAFFNSADNRFQRAGDFLRLHQFDSISDCSANTCDNSRFSVQSDWEFMDGKSDACTGEDLFSWIMQDPGKPFFAAMWTYQTHYPYFFNGTPGNYSSDDFFNRYLNALQHSDQVFGNLMENLRKENLLESTLVVVVGDHGEAFGRHDQVSHGRKIYEENLHIPLLMINPAFASTRISGVGGLVDLAPTVMQLLRHKSPADWQGSSLLQKGREDRTYFFAPWSDFLFGYRERDKKYIYNATKDITEVYDLATDPFEEHNLASAVSSGEINVCHQRMAAWAQFVNTETSGMISEGAGSGR